MTVEPDSILRENPAATHYYDYVVGTETDPGLLYFIKNEIEEHLDPKKDVFLFIGSEKFENIINMGRFPNINIVATEDDFEGEATCVNEHTTRVRIITGVKGPDRKYVYFTSRKYCSEIYDVLRIKPVPDLTGYKGVPIRGHIEHVYSEASNVWLGFSMLELEYEFKLSTLEAE